MSSSTALLWKYSTKVNAPVWNRRNAAVRKIKYSNKWQEENSLNIVVGNSREILEKTKQLKSLSL